MSPQILRLPDEKCRLKKFKFKLKFASLKNKIRLKPSLKLIEM